MSAPLTARARARAELTREIKESARRQLGEVGASALSLRAVARDLGMVSSAVYRYFPSRDDLLTALIIDAYDAVGEAAEEAERSSGGPFVERWLALCRAVRGWARASPHEYALVYGSPVPGYEAPRDTIAPAQRSSAAALRVVADGVAATEVDPGPALPLPRVLRADLRRLHAIAPSVPEDVLARALQAWAALFGTLGLELYGHLNGVVSDVDAFFEHQMRRAALDLARRGR